MCAPKGSGSPSRLELLGASPPMARSEDPSSSGTNQEPSQHPPRKRPSRRPRLRRCLLKGCTNRFRPKHPRTRYCGRACSQKARRWSRWKAQQRYRATDGAKAKRQAQSWRRRKRIKGRKVQRKFTLSGARVITPRFFQRFLRPPRLLRDVCPDPAIATTEVLLPRLSPSPGARTGAGTALERRRAGEQPGMGGWREGEPEPVSSAGSEMAEDRSNILRGPTTSG